MKAIVEIKNTGFKKWAWSVSVTQDDRIENYEVEWESAGFASSKNEAINKAESAVSELDNAIQSHVKPIVYEVTLGQDNG